jgi:hypothetical protein
MLQTNVEEKIKTHILHPINPPTPERHAVYEVYGKI